MQLKVYDKPDYFFFHSMLACSGPSKRFALIVRVGLTLKHQLLCAP